MSLQKYRDFRPTAVDARGLGLPNKQDWLVGPVYRTRDSGPRDRSNFRSFLRALDGESENVQIHRFGHWGPGWFEIIIINPIRADLVTKAAEIADALENYPIVDEEDYSDLLLETAAQTWKYSSFRDRLKIMQRFTPEQSIFSIRHDYPPEDETGDLTAYLAGEL